MRIVTLREIIYIYNDFRNVSYCTTTRAILQYRCFVIKSSFNNNEFFNIFIISVYIYIY